MNNQQKSNQLLFSKRTIISINHSLFISFLHKIILIFHILAFLVGIVTIFLIAELQDNRKWLYSFEYISLILILLVIILDIFSGWIRYFILRDVMKQVWGKNKVEGKIVKPHIIEYDKFENFASIKKSKTRIINEKITIGWNKNNLFSKKLIINIFVDAQVNQIMYTDIASINLRDKIVSLKCYFFDAISNENRVVIIDYDRTNNIMTWSGILPKHPVYGEWKLSK